MKKYYIILLVIILFKFNYSISSLEKIYLAHEINWIPQYGESLENGGYTVEIAREALKRVGYELVPVWLPWKRAQIMTEKGDYDGLGASYYTSDRAKKYLFSDPVSQHNLVFYKRKNTSIKYTQLEDLKGYTIGVGRGYAYPRIFEEADFLTKEIGKDVENNIQKLMTNRVDIIIGAKKSIQYYLRKNFPTRITDAEQLGKVISTEKLYILISLKTTQPEKKVKDFNQGLKMIKKDGTYTAILRKHGFEQ